MVMLCVCVSTHTHTNTYICPDFVTYIHKWCDKNTSGTLYGVSGGDGPDIISCEICCNSGIVTNPSVKICNIQTNSMSNQQTTYLGTSFVKNYFHI